MRVVDGSYGEGGGQILRTSVALSCVTGEDVRIVNIRAKRPKPGLKRQHLTAIKAAATLCRAEVEGLEVGSREVTFKPSGIRGGSYRFDIGTAGSITLVLQTLVPIMAYAPQPVRVVITGGTDVPWSPPIDYFANVLTWHLRLLGYELHIERVRRGHYPKGGGLVKASVENPPRELRPVRLLRRGDVERIEGISHCVKLPKHVAVRQAKAAEKRLREGGIRSPISILIEHYEGRPDPHLGPGSGIVVWAVTRDARLGADSLGARGKRAEKVGREAAEKLLEDLLTGAALDRHMSDNILPYIALAAGESVVSGARLTMHAHTVVWVVKQLLNTDVRLEGSLGAPFKAIVRGAGIKL